MIPAIIHCCWFDRNPKSIYFRFRIDLLLEEVIERTLLINI